MIPSPSQSQPAAGGFSLPELLVALLLLGLMTSHVALQASRMLGRESILPAAAALASELRLRRAEARTLGVRLGLHFERQGDDWLVSLLEDGDGDGLRADDRRAGIDPVLEGPQSFAARYGQAGPGFLPGLVDFRSPPPAGRRLDSLEDPLKLGRGKTLSMGPDGRGNSGTLYLSDGRQRQLALVVQGATGRIRLWEWDLKGRSWRAR